MREDEERTEHLKTGTSGGRLSLYEADPPPMQCDNFVEEESDVEETIDGQLPAPPPSTVVEAKPAVRRGFLNRTPEPPAPPPPPPKPVGETTPVGAFALEAGLARRPRPPSRAGAVDGGRSMAWRGLRQRPAHVDAMPSDEERRSSSRMLG